MKNKMNDLIKNVRDEETARIVSALERQEQVREKQFMSEVEDAGVDLKRVILARFFEKRNLANYNYLIRNDYFKKVEFPISEGLVSYSITPWYRLRLDYFSVEESLIFPSRLIRGRHNSFREFTKYLKDPCQDFLEDFSLDKRAWKVYEKVLTKRK